MSTIAAISTAVGNGGIGIIRLSGDKTFEIIKKIFEPKDNSFDNIKGYTIKYGKIVDSNNNVIDEVLVSFFVAPKSYTRENMCEINSHGGMIVEKKILEECLKNGAILAEPGEFTKKAFLNGRIDLSQAEAVIDLINSKTEKETQSSIKQLEGSLSIKLSKIRKRIISIMADIEASIDYPEYDIEETTKDKIEDVLNNSEKELMELEESFNKGKIIKNGIKTSIIGKPNVGKSSLLNLLLDEDRAIVSDIEGTTRDTIEESINIKGIPLKVIDTAGIRDTNDEIEKIGVKKSIDTIYDSDLIIALFDNSRELEQADIEIAKLLKQKNCIILLNKSDKANKLEKNEELMKLNKKIIKFSTKTEMGIKELYSGIEELFDLNAINTDDAEIITNVRQKEHITNAIKIINEAKEVVREDVPIDIISIYFKSVLEEIGSITGENVSEGIINEIFSKFCLGK